MGACGASMNAACGGAPLWCLSAPPFSTGKGSHDSQSPKGSLRIVFDCHPGRAGGTMDAEQWCHMTQTVRVTQTSPSGGSPRRGIGVHFPQAQPGLPVFPIAPCRGFEGFIIRGALYDLKGACHLLRSGETNRKLTPLSSVAYGATRWPGIKVFA